MKLSVVLPTYNEMSLGLYPRILQRLKSVPEVEVIVVDRHSEDGTPELAQKQGFQVLSSESNSRAVRLNVGIAQASAPMILLHHPRSLLLEGALEALLDVVETTRPPSSSQLWGGFTHQFDIEHPLLRFTSWYSNEVRAKRRGIIYLDHCIFAHRKLLGRAPFVPEVEIFEDTLLSEKLYRRAGAPLILRPISQTSALRFQRRGIWRQALLNQALKVGYHLNFPNTWMNRIYENRIWLNSKQ